MIGVFRNHNLYNSLSYKFKFGLNKNIDEASTFSEKIFFLKNSYSKINLATIVSDKIAVREYVRNMLGDSCLNRVFLTTIDPELIDYNSLPNKFVIKTNHGTGTNIFVKDKLGLNASNVSNQLMVWLKKNFSDVLGEM
jgi:hypothetical protein